MFPIPKVVKVTSFPYIQKLCAAVGSYMAKEFWGLRFVRL